VASVNANQANVAIPLPIGGVISNLRVRINGTPGNGNSYTFTVVRNGTAITGFTCPMTDSTTTCTDTDTTTWAAGDTISLQSVPNSNPTGRIAVWSVTIG
jgi:hypothetical protein